MPRLHLLRILQAHVGALLLLASGIFCFAAEPQYSLDHSFRPPTFTSFATAARVLVLADDRFYAFSNSAPGVQRAVQRLEGEPYGSLIRFKPDGAVDPTFRLDQQLTGYTINAVALVAEGKLVVACIPSNPDVDPVNRVLRLKADGSIDPTFAEGLAAKAPGSQQTVVQSIVAAEGGKLLVAGQFGDYNNSGRPWLVRLDRDGAVDTTFAAVNLQNQYSHLVGVISDTGLALQSDGKVLMAGGFSTVNGVTRPGIVRLHGNGTLDTSFVPQGFTPSTSYQTLLPQRAISSVVVLADGKLLLGGVFNPIRAYPTGTSTQMLVRLNPNGGADSSFDAHRNHPPLTAKSLKLLPDGRPLVGFEASTSGSVLGGVARYQAGGAHDTSFNSNFPAVTQGRVANVALQSSGKAIFAGGFRTLAGLLFCGVGRANEDGTLDTAFRPGELQREQIPERLAVRRDGRVVATGLFDRVNNMPRAGLALLERDGSAAQLSYSHKLASPKFLLHADDKLLLFGNATDTGRFACARFHADASRDTSFNADPATMEFQGAMLQPDGSYLVSSGDSAQAVANEVLLTRMKPDGSQDPSFDLGIEEHLLVERYDHHPYYIYRMYSGDNRALALLPNGKILYHYFDRDSLHKVVVLEPNGAVDSSFQAGTATPRETMEWFPQIYDPKTGYTLQPSEGVVEPTGVGPSIALIEPDGRIILAGQFTSYNGVPAGGIVRLKSDGSLSSTFGSGAAFTTTAVTWEREPGITAVERDFAGRLLVAGDFDTFHGVPSPGIARLNADGSVDTTFVPPVGRRNAGTAFNNRSALARQAAGSFLLAGNYGAAGSTAATSIFRLHIPVRATSVVKTSQSALSISFTGVPGETYKIEHAASMSSAFSDSGTRLQATPHGTFVYEDPTGFSSLQRFYRAVTLP